MIKKKEIVVDQGNTASLYIPKVESLDDFEKHYVWVNEFTDTSFKEFFVKFMKLERDPSVQVVPVVISSYGGAVDVLNSMRDIMKSCAKPVATIGTGKAMSAGAGLLAAGTKGYRFGSETLRVMIHEISSMYWGKNNDMQVDAKESARLNKQQLTHIAQDAGKTYEWIMSQLHAKKNADWYMGAAEAKRVGIIDHIGVPRIGHQQHTTNVLLVSTNE